MAAGDPISDLSDFILLATGGGSGAPEKIVFSKKMALADGSAPAAFSAGRITSLWRFDGQPAGTPTTPSTAVVCTNATAGALRQTTSAAGTHKRLNSVFAVLSGGSPYSLLIYDRLSHQGGLSGTVTGAQTTNLPTAALTRRTTGLGVEAWLEIYATLGTTAGGPTISYTNDSGTSGQVSISTSLGATNFNSAERMCVVPLASGDRGVRAVASVTVPISTGTAGNFGVTLGYPITMTPIQAHSYGTIKDMLRTIGGPLSLGVASDACLALAIIPTSTITNFEMMGWAEFLEK